MATNYHLHRPSESGILPRVTSSNEQYLRRQFCLVVADQTAKLGTALMQYDIFGLVEPAFSEFLPDVWAHLEGTSSKPIPTIARDRAVDLVVEDLWRESRSVRDRWSAAVPELRQGLTRSAAEPYGTRDKAA